MKKYFLIVGIAILCGCARQQDIATIRNAPAPDQAPHIVNGKIVNLAKDERGKTVVFLASQTAEGTANCTGTIIGTRAILTAGHCLEGVSSVVVRFAAAPAARIAVAGWKVHPHYRKPEKTVAGQMSPDLALVRLKSAIPAGARIARMGSRADKLTLGQAVLSYGYGFSEAGTDDFFGVFEWDFKKNNQQLNAGTFAVIAAKDAGSLLKKSKLGQDGAVFMTHANKSSICQGDSGGPTFLASAPEPTIIGVNSFITDGTCLKALNGLADLRFQRGWVDQTLAQWFPTVPPRSPAPVP